MDLPDDNGQEKVKEKETREKRNTKRKRIKDKEKEKGKGKGEENNKRKRGGEKEEKRKKEKWTSHMFVGVMQVWVHETQAADDVGLFDDLPQHLRAQVAWRQNKDLMGGIHTFRVSHPSRPPCMWLSTLHF